MPSFNCDFYVEENFKVSSNIDLGYENYEICTTRTLKLTKMLFKYQKTKAFSPFLFHFIIITLILKFFMLFALCFDSKGGT